MVKNQIALPTATSKEISRILAIDKRITTMKIIYTFLASLLLLSACGKKPIIDKWGPVLGDWNAVIYEVGGHRYPTDSVVTLVIFGDSTFIETLEYNGAETVKSGIISWGSKWSFTYDDGVRIGPLDVDFATDTDLVLVRFNGLEGDLLGFKRP